MDMEEEEVKIRNAKPSMDGEAAVERLMEAVEEIAAISDYRNAYKKQFGNLSRRVKLLAPMFEELKESREPIPDEAVRGLVQLRKALDAARELLRFGSDGSKIFLVRRAAEVG